jgi:hypothetical protein
MSLLQGNARAAPSPPPLWGRDRVGGNPYPRMLGVPPPLTPPHKGEGNPRGICRRRSHGARSLIGNLFLMITVLLSSVDLSHAAELTFDLKIQGGRVPQNMRLVRVKQGDAVKLRWTSDRAIVLHLHGYDIERRVEPGMVSEMAFVARATGRFSVEEHKPDAKGGHSHGEAALVRIEVLPK